MKLTDYRRLKVIPVKGGFALAARGGKAYLTASVRTTEQEVKDLALVWTAQCAHDVASECAEELSKLRGTEVRLGDLLA